MKIKRAKPFFRGLRLDGRKNRTKDSPIEILPPVGEVAIPLDGHIGAPAVPVVKAGEYVKLGQLVGKRADGVSANVHASVSGRVTAIEERPNGQGGASLCVVIENDGKNTAAYLDPLVDPDGESIIKRVEEAGIVGMGGAGFPTHVKLRPSRKVDVLILNGAECEPYLTCDDRLMRENHKEIVRGARYLQRALGAERVMIGIERNKPEALALFKESGLEVVALPKRYPMGSEKHLVYCATGRKVPPRGLPAEVGAAVQNVATAFAVAQAVEDGKPLTSRVVTVAGDGVLLPKNLLAPVGAPFSALLSACSANGNAVKAISGGPMTGKAMRDFDGTVMKTTAGLLLLTERETEALAPTPCINCGKCAAACPMKLLPMQIEYYAAAGNYEAAERYGGVLSCIGCAACLYVCPARRPLSSAIQAAKKHLGRQKA